MKYLLLISIIVYFTFNNCLAQTNYSSQCNVINRNDSSGLYKFYLSVYNNNISGLLLFKKTSDSTIRAVLTSEMGPKIIDLELNNTSYKVNFAIKQLRKKIILKSFYTDFASIAGILKFNKESGRYFSEQSDSSKLNKTVLYNKKGQELEIYYFCNNNKTNADSVFLQHFNFKMRIELRKIDF